MNNFPIGPLWIHGAPYRIEFHDLPEPDDKDYAWMIRRREGVIRLQTDTTRDYAARNVVGAIVREASMLLGPDSRHDNWQESAFARLLYGTLKTNPDVLAFCAGWSDSVPQTVDVAGARWTVEMVDHCPGYDKLTAGLTVYRQQTIYLTDEHTTAAVRPVLLHEVCHAVADVAAPALVEHEQFIRAVHVTMQTALVQNPDFMKALFEWKEEAGEAEPEPLAASVP